MLKLDHKLVRGIDAATEVHHLFDHLQNAVELEHATIPPYLTAMLSLKPGTNDMIRSLLRTIVIEEMLHMTIASNILIAIGGRPEINHDQFVPAYPGSLPMHIGGDDFEVPIKAFSMALLEDVFMKIEEPDEPIPVEHAAETRYATIGHFYEAIKNKIVELGDDIFVVGPERQVLDVFSSDKIFPITDVASSSRAIDIILIEGEGSSTNPFESAGDPAHYYKFGEIHAGKKIIKTADGGFAYGGDAIPFDPAGVFPMMDNPHVEDFADGSPVREGMVRFAYTYSRLLDELHDAFNGNATRVEEAIRLMFELTTLAGDLMTLEVGNGKTAGPSYHYVEA